MNAREAHEKSLRSLHLILWDQLPESIRGSIQLAVLEERQSITVEWGGGEESRKGVMGKLEMLGYEVGDSFASSPEGMKPALWISW